MEGSHSTATFSSVNQGLDGIPDYDDFEFSPSIGEPKDPAPETGQ